MSSDRHSLGVGSLVLNPLIAAMMAIVLAVFLMDLQNSGILVRIVAITGPFWMVFLQR